MMFTRGKSYYSFFVVVVCVFVTFVDLKTDETNSSVCVKLSYRGTKPLLKVCWEGSLNVSELLHVSSPLAK